MDAVQYTYKQASRALMNIRSARAFTGPVKVAGSAYIFPSQGQSPAQMGGVGGNVAYIDGSISWKHISQMQTYWTFSLDDQHRGLW
jgi:hypothetical protein